MTDHELRLEALKMALHSPVTGSKPAEDLIAAAEKFYAFLEPSSKAKELAIPTLKA